MPKPSHPPPMPTTAAITQYWKRWQNNEAYALPERTLSLLFNDLYPTNTKEEQVLLKVIVLNRIYGTNIWDTTSVAKHIMGLDIDNRLKCKDISLVNDLASMTFRGKARMFYSFATKYCSMHCPESFPIYDSLVKKMLLHFRDADGFTSFQNGDLNRYDYFVRIVHSFQSHYGLQQHSLKQIDVFLWLGGKESFPANISTSPANSAGLSSRPL